MGKRMTDENQVPVSLVEEIEIMLAVGGLSPAQHATFRKAAERIRELEAHGLCRCADEIRCEMRKLIADCDPYLKDGETPAECIQRNRDDTGAALKLLAKEKRKYEALVGGIKSSQSHTSETLRLLQWDQLGWDVPEEVIESLVKADSKLRALLEDDDG